MTLEYVTTRGLSGKKQGKIRIMKLAEETDGVFELTCPECGNVDKKKEMWRNPFVEGEGKNQKFNVSCRKCGFKTTIMKLKKEVKKKKA